MKPPTAVTFLPTPTVSMLSIAVYVFASGVPKSYVIALFSLKLKPAWKYSAGFAAAGQSVSVGRNCTLTSILA